MIEWLDVHEATSKVPEMQPGLAGQKQEDKKQTMLKSHPQGRDE